jgi:hypothetical protein
MCVHYNFIWFPSQHNYQNLIHISLCIMSLLPIIVLQCATCFSLKSHHQQYTLTNIFKLLNCVLYMNSLQHNSQNSVISIATGYELDDWEVEVQVVVGSRIFSSPSHPDQLWGPPNLLSNGYCGLFPQRLKLPEREANYSPPASCQGQENMDLYIHSPCLHGLVLS